MKILILLGVICMLAAGCGGKLSDEQRQRLREGMKAGEIRRVPEAEFIEAAYTFGRNIRRAFQQQDPYLANPALIDSMERAHSVRVTRFMQGDSNRTDIERKLMEAYTGPVTGSSDHVQKINTDSTLYTWPVVSEKPDGTFTLLFVAAMKIPNKQIILSIED